MVTAIPSRWTLVTVLYVCLSLTNPIIAFLSAYEHFIGGATSGFISSPQKTMGKPATSLSMRAFRVISREAGLYHKWLIVEDTMHHRFQSVTYTASRYPPTKAMKTTIDHDDEWCVLNYLRNIVRVTEIGSAQPLGADSISAAIAHQQTQWRELQEVSSQAVTPMSVTKAAPHTDSDSTSKVMPKVTRSHEPIEEDLQRMIDEVWDFARGVGLEWQPRGRTSAGNKCEVLTFNGSDKVLVHPSFLEVQ